MAYVFNDLPDFEIEGELDTFETVEDASYPRPTFFKGNNKLVKPDPKVKGNTPKFIETGEVASGFMFLVNNEKYPYPQSFRDAMDVLVEAGQADIVSVRHIQSGAVEDYYRIHDALWFPLATGVISRFEVQENIERAKGVAVGLHTTPNWEKNPPEGETYTRTNLLVIEKHLAEMGYVDESGLPGMVMISTSGNASGELFNALKQHGQFILYLRNKLGFAPGKATFFNFGMRLRPSDAQVQRKSGAAALTIQSGHPAIFSQEYAEAVYAGDDLARAMKHLIYAQEDGRWVQNGKAMLWCRKNIESMQRNQAELNPDGKLPLGKAALNKEVVAAHKRIEGSPDGAARVAPPEPAGVGGMDTAELLKQIERKLEFFRRKQHEQGIAAMTQLKEDVGDGLASPEDVVAALDEATNWQKELRAASTGY